MRGKKIPDLFLFILLFMENIKNYIFSITIMITIAFSLKLFFKDDILNMLSGIIISGLFTMIIIEPIKQLNVEKNHLKQIGYVFSNLKHIHEEIIEDAFCEILKLIPKCKINNLNQAIQRMKTIKKIDLSKLEEQGKNNIKHFYEKNHFLYTFHNILNTLKEPLDIITNFSNKAVFKDFYFSIKDLEETAQIYSSGYQKQYEALEYVKQLQGYSSLLLDVFIKINDKWYLRTLINLYYYKSYNNSCFDEIVKSYCIDELTEGWIDPESSSG